MPKKKKKLEEKVLADFVNFPVRFSRAQYELVRECAAVAGKPTSTWLRDAALCVAGDSRDVSTLLKALNAHVETKSLSI